MLTSEYARSLANPFQYSACIPDGARGVGCFSVKQTGTIQTGTVGTCYGIIAQPYPDSFILVDTASIHPDTRVPATWSAAVSGSTIQSTYAEVRPISMGIRVNYIGNTINDQGIIFVGEFSHNLWPGTDLQNKTLVQLSSQAMWYQTYPLREGARITWRPISASHDCYFAPINTSPHTSSAINEYSILVVYVFGAATASASSCQYEVVANFEGKYKLQNFISGGLKDSSNQIPEPGWYESALAMIANLRPYAPAISEVVNSGLSLAGRYASRSILGTMANGMPQPRRLTSSPNGGW